MIFIGKRPWLIIDHHYLNFCAAHNDSLCEDGEIRLYSSDTVERGRLEVCYDGIWGAICNEQWTDTDAKVACNQLRLPSEGNIAELQYSVY